MIIDKKHTALNVIVHQSTTIDTTKLYNGLKSNLHRNTNQQKLEKEVTMLDQLFILLTRVKRDEIVHNIAVHLDIDTHTLNSNIMTLTFPEFLLMDAEILCIEILKMITVFLICQDPVLELRITQNTDTEANTSTILSSLDLSPDKKSSIQQT